MEKTRPRLAVWRLCSRKATPAAKACCPPAAQIWLCREQEGGVAPLRADPVLNIPAEPKSPLTLLNILIFILILSQFYLNFIFVDSIFFLRQAWNYCPALPIMHHAASHFVRFFSTTPRCTCSGRPVDPHQPTGYKYYLSPVLPAQAMMVRTNFIHSQGVQQVLFV